MLRLTLFPLVLFFGTLILSIVAYFIIKKIRKVIATTLEKGKNIAVEQQKKWGQWEQKEQRKKLPTIIQKGLDDYDEIESEIKRLPDSWAVVVMPITEQAKTILDEVMTEAVVELERVNTKNKQGKSSRIKSQKLNAVRPFFNHSLDALLQFVKKLNSDHATMDDIQVEKARQNITVFKADFDSHEAALKKSRKMDFDVVMDVIKARLKK